MKKMASALALSAAGLLALTACGTQDDSTTCDAAQVQMGKFDESLNSYATASGDDMERLGYNAESAIWELRDNANNASNEDLAKVLRTVADGFDGPAQAMVDGASVETLQLELTELIGDAEFLAANEELNTICAPESMQPQPGQAPAQPQAPAEDEADADVDADDDTDAADDTDE